MNNSIIINKNEYINECINEEIINLSYYTQNKNISNPIEHINITTLSFNNNSHTNFEKFFNNSSGYFIKFTE